jgi:hypothetical protein
MEHLSIKYCTQREVTDCVKHASLLFQRSDFFQIPVKSFQSSNHLVKEPMPESTVTSENRRQVETRLFVVTDEAENKLECLSPASLSSMELTRVEH